MDNLAVTSLLHSMISPSNNSLNGQVRQMVLASNTILK